MEIKWLRMTMKPSIKPDFELNLGQPIMSFMDQATYGFEA